MMKSYVKFLSRNKLYATIEALGLSVALAFVLILVSYATAEYRVGTNQKLAKELYVAGSGDYLGMTWGIAKEFFPSIPEIKGWTRFGEYYAPQGAMIDGQYYEAKYLAIDPNFSQFMGYKCRGCAPDHLLSDAHQAMVSESFAKKAFGNANPIGRTIQCGKLQLKVVGIMEDFDREDLLNPYDIFVSMKLIEAEAQAMDQFGSCITVARLAKDAYPEKVRQTLLGKYMNYWKGWKKDSDGVTFMWGCRFVRWDQIHFTADSVDIFKHGNRTLVNILLVVALVLLLSALFNYINLTVAQIGNRAKEMATRRLLGESVGGVMLRYLKESALFTAVCFLLGLLISWAFIPLFNSMLDTKIDLFHSFDLLWFLPLAYVIISIFAGILPAIVVSRFNPIDVVKGTIRMRSKMWFSKIFIVAQNVISITLVVMAITMMLQMKHLADLPLGYQTKDIVSIFSSLDGSPEKMSILRNRLKALPEVEEATYGNANPISSWGNGVHGDNEKLIGMLRMFLADSTAMKMLGIRVIEQYCEPAYGKIWVTEDAKRAYGVSAHKPWFGMRLENGKHEYEVCGVIADYHSGDALSENEKTEHNAIGVITPQQGGWVVLVKTRGDHAQALQAIRNTCKQVAKELIGVPTEMEAEYMDDTLKNNLKDKHNMMVLIITFMSISILISALGLFGMSVYYGNQQKRQIALRKVMGASIGDAAWQLAKRFLVSSLVAVVIAIPICVKLMQTYLMDFVHRISFPWWVLLAGAIFTLLIAFVSVIGSTLRTAMSNPIDSIKAE
jgi:putative ABC transport system permease protein